MMKEIVLRIIHSATSQNQIRDPIFGVSKEENDTKIVHHCAITSADTLLQEDINCGLVVALRFRYLSNPPPHELSRDAYLTVLKLEISCPIEVSWVFGLCSNLPKLNLIRFGSSCFETPFGDCRPVNQSWLTRCPSVKELILTFNHKKLKEEGFDKNHLIETIDSILNYSSKYFIELVKADIYVPAQVKLDWFLNEFPGLRATGDKTEIFQNEALHFRSHAYKADRLLMRLGSTESSIPLKRSKSTTSEISRSSEDNEPCSTTISPRINEFALSRTSSHCSDSYKHEEKPILKLHDTIQSPKARITKTPSPPPPPPIDPIVFQSMFTRRPRK